MSYEVRVLQVAPGPLAVVRGVANLNNLSSRIRALFDQVYGLLAKGAVRQDGQNVIVYLDVPGKNLLASPEGCPIEVGVQVAAPFTNGAGLMSSATPGGMAVTAVHMGPYDQIKMAHHAIHQWSADHHYTLAGPNWEIYGDWNDQPDQLRTDVFYLLKDLESKGE